MGQWEIEYSASCGLLYKLKVNMSKVRWCLLWDRFELKKKKYKAHCKHCNAMWNHNTTMTQMMHHLNNVHPILANANPKSGCKCKIGWTGRGSGRGPDVRPADCRRWGHVVSEGDLSTPRVQSHRLAECEWSEVTQDGGVSLSIPLYHLRSFLCFFLQGCKIHLKSGQRRLKCLKVLGFIDRPVSVDGDMPQRFNCLCDRIIINTGANVWRHWGCVFHIC